MDVIKKLNDLKRQNNLNNYRLAKICGLPQATLSNIFTRHAIPRLDTIEIICNALGITLAQFFHDGERYVFLTDSQFEMFNNWMRLPRKKKEIFNQLLKLLIEDDENDSEK